MKKQKKKQKDHDKKEEIDQEELDLEISFLPDWDRCPVSDERAAAHQQAFLDGLIEMELDRYDAREAAGNDR